jgi:hypothetical protein
LPCDHSPSFSGRCCCFCGGAERRPDDPANVNYQAYAAISADGGSSFQPNVELTQSFSNPNVFGIGNASCNGAAWDGPNYFLTAWMDTSNGMNTQDVVGGIRLK